jgi:hypothetical protein
LGNFGKIDLKSKNMEEKTMNYVSELSAKLIKTVEDFQKETLEIHGYQMNLVETVGAAKYLYMLINEQLRFMIKTGNQLYPKPNLKESLKNLKETVEKNPDLFPDEEKIYKIENFN